MRPTAAACSSRQISKWTDVDHGCHGQDAQGAGRRIGTVPLYWSSPYILLFHSKSEYPIVLQYLTVSGVSDL
jgi:hypothetical protein